MSIAGTTHFSTEYAAFATSKAGRMASAIKSLWNCTSIQTLAYATHFRRRIVMANHATQSASAKRKTTSRSASTSDAISLLKADHRQVEEWFEEFEKARSETRKAELAAKICTALIVHTTIEEEIFYPAFYEATEDEDTHHEAIIEHVGAKKLIREIQETGPRDEYFDARVKVLSEMIKHHVKEEEQRGGMFAEAKQSDLDLQTLGEQMAARKKELMSQGQESQGH